MADSVTFRFSGGDQFVVDLRAWRDRLRGDVHDAAGLAGNRIASLVASQYPYRTGNLRAHVKVTDESFTDGVLFRVRSLARHSHLVERGTRARRTRRGWSRGVMPKTPIFIPSAMDARVRFKADVRRILASPEPAIGAGTPTVTGEL